MMKIAVLDDYQNVALKSADWSPVAERAEITAFNDHLSDPLALVERLLPFDVICVMRERTPLTRSTEAASERGIAVTGTRYWSTPTIEMTWALILASVRHIVEENAAVRDHGWQGSIGEDLHGKNLGVLGLGNIGREVARIGRAFGMKIIAWSQNMTPELATAAGATLVAKDELFRQADVVTIHVILSRRTRGLVGAAELALMKPTARLINTSRGPIVDEASLIKVLQSRSIAGAALDVFDEEPLPALHPFRTLSNVLATPHVGYVAEGLYRAFYEDAAASIAAWLDDQAIDRSS
jgi:phosphoglycerate dehydrogenase-like enzyme